METFLPYGNEKIAFSLPGENLLGVLEASSLPVIDKFRDIVQAIIERPTAGLPLPEIIKARKPETAAIVVNDLTRSTPTSEVLPVILDLLKNSGIDGKNISIVIATGTHRPLDRREIEKVAGMEVSNNYHVVNHDCDSPDLVSFGKLSTGNELLVNNLVAKADLKIAVGEVLFHYYAGFAGGRKSLLPGVTGRQTTMANHGLMLHPGAKIGNIVGNPVHDEMLEAHCKCPFDFIVNTVANSRKEVVSIVGGDPIKAWLRGVETFNKMNTVGIEKQADVVIVSSGGLPKDLNFLQAHKAMELAAAAVKDGGSLILVAECREGYGHPVFAEWANQSFSRKEVFEKIAKKFTFGGHKLYFLARLAERMKLYLISSLDAAASGRIFCEKIDKTSDIVQVMRDRHGKNFSAWIIPQGGVVMPVFKRHA